jgi:hypothetical protein
MKKFLSLIVAAVVVMGGSVEGDLIITGLADPDGGTGDALELYAVADIADLSIYGLETAANSNSSTGSPSSTLATGSLAAGDFYYVTSDDEDFTRFFGFDADEDLNININGNDAVLLYQSGNVIDTVLDDGDDTDVHGDGWIYRNDDEGPNTTFTLSEWTASTDVLGNSNSSTNADSTTPFPIGTYTRVAAIPEPSSIALFGLASVAGIVRRRK